jgi:lysozyme
VAALAVNPSEQLIAWIKREEGFSATAYQDEAGVWTVGYGWTAGVGPNSTMSEWAADQILRNRLAAIAKALAAVVKVPLTQGQWDALYDFSYNCGLEALATSTLPCDINAGNMAQAAAEFGRWIYTAGKKSNRLIVRRQTEAGWFAGQPIEA